MKKISLDLMEKSFSKEEMKMIKAGSGSTCNLTVAACWRTASRDNAKSNGKGAWVCC